MRKIEKKSIQFIPKVMALGEAHDWTSSFSLTFQKSFFAVHRWVDGGSVLLRLKSSCHKVGSTLLTQNFGILD